MRILLAEDEKALSKALCKILEKNNFAVDAVYNGDDALNCILSEKYDAVVLDIMMPGIDGISVLRKTREAGNNIPIMMLTAKSEVEDKVLGLDSGANDYLAKPFDTRELIARIRSITRTQNAGDTRLRMGNTELDRSRYILSTPDGEEKLANKEYQLMEYLMLNPHRIISTDRFIEKVWGFDSDVEMNTVWVYFSNLRKKLNQLNSNIQIKAYRNIGYSLEDGNGKKA